ncbi:hypothetical protein L6452_22382 [Arctium lappa]|uniref:Uncharacterized protein n=1 Tax=Arctium lappa TaxID=4217 RepID=A0ACB9AZN2_ARCLA|nr:hypothetical protein L6452_22382 [Arctium lappa]
MRDISASCRVTVLETKDEDWRDKNRKGQALVFPEISSIVLWGIESRWVCTNFDSVFIGTEAVVATTVEEHSTKVSRVVCREAIPDVGIGCCGADYLDFLGAKDLRFEGVVAAGVASVGSAKGIAAEDEEIVEERQRQSSTKLTSISARSTSRI